MTLYHLVEKTSRHKLKGFSPFWHIPTSCLAVISFTRIMPFLQFYISWSLSLPIFLISVLWLYFKIFFQAPNLSVVPPSFPEHLAVGGFFPSFYCNLSSLPLGLLHVCWPGLSCLLGLDLLFTGSHDFFLGLLFIFAKIYLHVAF